mgnify:CR=1 FL=1
MNYNFLYLYEILLKFLGWYNAFENDTDTISSLSQKNTFLSKKYVFAFKKLATWFQVLKFLEIYSYGCLVVSKKYLHDLHTLGTIYKLCRILSIKFLKFWVALLTDSTTYFTLFHTPPTAPPSNVENNLNLIFIILFFYSILWGSENIRK